MKNEKFSLLEADRKTHHHVIEYFNAMLNNIDLFSVDMILQKRELELHLNKCHKEKDQEECLKWVEKNAKPFRIYINSLREIALFCYIDSKIYFRKELSWEVFCLIIEIWNKNKSIIDSIKTEDI